MVAAQQLTVMLRSIGWLGCDRVMNRQSAAHVFNSSTELVDCIYRLQHRRVSRTNCPAAPPKYSST